MSIWRYFFTKSLSFFYEYLRTSYNVCFNYFHKFVRVQTKILSKGDWQKSANFKNIGTSMYSALQVFRPFSLPLHTVDHYSTIILQFCSCRPCTTYPRGGDYAFYLIASLCLSSSQNNYLKITWLQTQIELFEEIKNKKIKNTRGMAPFISLTFYSIYQR